MRWLCSVVSQVSALGNTQGQYRPASARHQVSLLLTAQEGFMKSSDTSDAPTYSSLSTFSEPGRVLGAVDSVFTPSEQTGTILSWDGYLYSAKRVPYD